MAKTKRESKVLDKATARLTGMKAIDPTLDLGEKDLTVASMTAKCDALKGLVERYNALLAEADAGLNRILAAEEELKDVTARVLQAVSARYGRDSDELEKVGGVRQSERKPPVRTKKLPA